MCKHRMNKRVLKYNDTVQSVDNLTRQHTLQSIIPPPSNMFQLTMSTLKSCSGSTLKIIYTTADQWLRLMAGCYQVASRFPQTRVTQPFSKPVFGPCKNPGFRVWHFYLYLTQMTFSKPKWIKKLMCSRIFVTS